MITLSKACKLASQFYEENLQVYGLARVSETDQFYIFSGGSGKMVSYGGITISIDKSNGNISVLRFPSKISTDLINSAKEIEFPDDFKNA